jgi:hypothetical protein
MEIGMKVIIGDKYARDCSYKDIVGKQGTITGESYVKTNPYRLKGKFLFYRVDIPNRYDWEVHVDDILPVSNKLNKGVLERLED